MKYPRVYMVNYTLPNGREAVSYGASSRKKAAELAAKDITKNIISTDISVSPNFLDYYRVQILFKGRVFTCQYEEHELSIFLEKGAIIVYWNAANVRESVWIDELKIMG